MALSDSSLKEKIQANLEACGFTAIAQNECLMQAIAKAVVDEIKQNAQVVVVSGSSAGTYQVS